MHRLLHFVERSKSSAFSVLPLHTCQRQRPPSARARFCGSWPDNLKAGGCTARRAWKQAHPVWSPPWRNDYRARFALVCLSHQTGPAGLETGQPPGLLGAGWQHSTSIPVFAKGVPVGKNIGCDVRTVEELGHVRRCRAATVRSADALATFRAVIGSQTPPAERVA